MKKLMHTFVAAVTLGVSMLLAGCADAIVNDGTHVRKYTGGVGSGNGLYRVAEGYELGAWGCWDNDGDTAAVSNAPDGGLHIVPNSRNCGSTYCGVNLAAGTEVGKNADLDGSMFTKVVFELRGNIDASLISFYGLNEDKTKKCGTIKGSDANGNDVFEMLDALGTDYNADTWTEITIDLPNSTDKMTSALTLSIGNDPKWSSDNWVEIRNIDWQDASGNSVIPVYVD